MQMFDVLLLIEFMCFEKALPENTIELRFSLETDQNK